MRRMFRAGSEGFTFVDAVVAVLLSAAAAGAVVPLFAVFIRRWPEYQVRRRDAVSLMNLEADLRRELGAAEVPYWSGGAGLSGASGAAESSGPGGGPAGGTGESRLTGGSGQGGGPGLSGGPGSSGQAGGLGLPGGAGLPGEPEGPGRAGAPGSTGIIDIERFEGGLVWGEGEFRVRVLRGDGAVSVSSSGVTRRYRFTDAPGVSVLLSEGGGMIGVRITAAGGAEADVLFGERRLESGEEPGL